MRKVPRYPQRIIASGNARIDSAFSYYSQRYPRLCAHVSEIRSGDRNFLGIKSSPYRAVMFYGFDPETDFDATQLIGYLLHFLARDLRHASKPRQVHPSNGGSAP